jgi:peptide/nickel transport system permease protein
MSVAAATTAAAEARTRRRRNSKLLVGAGILGVLVGIAVFAPIVAIHNPEAIDPSRVLGSPTWAHPFGSDVLGRDVFSRVVYAYRVSLSVAVGSVLLAFVLGIPVGLLAGYYAGWVDMVLMRPVDMLLAFPALLLAVALIAILGPGTWIALFAIALIYLPILARVVRSSVLVTSTQDFVEGARARGARTGSILLRHVLPNSVGPAIVQATVLMGFAIQIEAALSFLGLGAQPPTPSLGVMLADGRDVLSQAPWVEIFPGLAIAATVVAFFLIGDGLRERLDPRGVANR